MKYCNHCGIGLADDAAFCPECGESFTYSQTQTAQQPAAQPVIQPTYQTQYIVPEQSGVTEKDIMTLGDYILSYFLLMIPVVQLVMPFVWAFGSSGKSKQNFGKAILLLWLISLGLSLVIVIICVAAGIGLGALFAPLANST